MSLAGCSLAEAWADAPQWRILETGFGLGTHFLTVWQAWRSDPQRPRLLHVVSIDPQPVARDALLRGADHASPESHALAQQLDAQWRGLLPGFHRLSFEGGRVLLTLCIGDVQAMLRAQRFEADSLWLNGFGAGHESQETRAMGSPDTLKALSRFARRGTRLVARTAAPAVADALVRCGFRIDASTDVLHGVYDPAWTPRRRTPEARPTPAGHCAVIGAGLAGAAVAASLVRRGWRVTVMEAATAAGHRRVRRARRPAGAARLPRRCDALAPDPCRHPHDAAATRAMAGRGRRLA